LSLAIQNSDYSFGLESLKFRIVVF
jgi:hypothetical protein